MWRDIPEYIQPIGGTLYSLLINLCIPLVFFDKPEYRTYEIYPLKILISICLSNIQKTPLIVYQWKFLKKIRSSKTFLCGIAM